MSGNEGGDMGWLDGVDRVDEVDGDAEMERLLRETFEARARQAVPDERRPPPIVWADAPRARPAWVAPLAVAASIAVVAGGLGFTVLHQKSQTLPPAGQTTTTAPPSPTAVPSTPSTSPAPSTSAAPSTSTVPTPPFAPTSSAPAGPTSPATPTGTRVQAAGATLVVPAGYTFRDAQGTGGSMPAGTTGPTWCLDTAGSSDCIIAFSPLNATQEHDSNAEGGSPPYPMLCAQGITGKTRELTAYHEGQSGGRAWEQRVWHWFCPEGPNVDVAQYTVMTPQAYILYSGKATAKVQADMADIMSTAVFPPATSSMRLFDAGIVRSVTVHTDASATITLDRAVPGRPNGSPTVYTYTIPAAIWAGTSLSPGGSADLVGKSLNVYTDGTAVTGFAVTGYLFS